MTDPELSLGTAAPETVERCTAMHCSRRAIALAIVGEWENLPGDVVAELKVCDGSPCMLSTDKGAEALEKLISDPYWDRIGNNAA